MKIITFDRVTRKYGRQTILENLSLTIQERDLFVFLGSPGCGKITVLRLLAGYETPTSGQIKIDDQILNQISPAERGFGVIFSSMPLFPKLTVYDNIAAGSFQKGKPLSEIDRSVKQAASLLAMDGIIRKQLKNISSINARKVQFAREIAAETELFIIDQLFPLTKSRDVAESHQEFLRVHRILQKTMIYSTQDPVEAMAIASRIAVLKEGVLQQVDPPQMIYQEPANLFVAGLIGSPGMNFFKVELIYQEDKLCLQGNKFRLTLPEEYRAMLFPHSGKELVLGIRPEDIYHPEYIPEEVSAGMVEVDVAMSVLINQEVFHYLASGKNQFIARTPSDAAIPPGNKQRVAFNLEKIHLFDLTQSNENPPAIKIRNPIQ